MPRPNYKGYESDEVPPDDFSQEGGSGDKVFVPDAEWADVETIAEKTALDSVKEDLAKLAVKTPPEPVSAPEQAIPAETEKPVPSKGKTSAQRKAEWRSKNLDHYRAKNREYVREYRKRQKEKK